MKIHNMEQRTDEWRAIRKGKVTGTGLKRIVGSATTRENYFYELIAERLTIGIPSDESAMARGVALEADARARYAAEIGVEVVEYGFLEDDTNPYIGCSPDGYVKSKKMDRGCEIKCLSGANHIRAYITQQIPKEYYPQGIQAFIVNKKLKLLDFVFYDNRIPAAEFFIITMRREDVLKDIAKYRAEQEQFLAEVDAQISQIISL